MAGGYLGKILYVDLSSGRLEDEPLDERLRRDFLGGYGIGARLIYDWQAADVDPLGPANHLGFVTGPLTGTPAIIGSRYAVVGKSPLTGTWGDANSGGYFGPTLKFTGYDGVIVTGVSERPVYVLIEDGEASLLDAGHLWGKTTLETRDALQAAHGKDTEEACIGPAGENLSLIACVINDYGRAAGRSGMGAVMGSKRLKAIAVRGAQSVPLADPQRAKELRKKYLRVRTEWSDVLRKWGTSALTYRLAMSGDSPVKNWRGDGPTDFATAAQINGDTVIAEQERSYGCWHCPIRCGGHMKAKPGRNRPVSHKPEYETLCAAGTLMLNDDLESIIRVNDTVNAYGLDSISAPCTVAFAVSCYEDGILTKAETGGLELRWGNSEAIVAMLERLARREGFGAVLADGVAKAAERIGRGSEKFAMHIQGQEVPMHDPRYTPGLTISYRMDATPARHTQGFEMVVPPGLDVDKGEKYDYAGKGEVHRKLTSLVHVVNAAGLCLFGYECYPIQCVPEFLSAVTGWDVTLEDLFVLGERIGSIRHLFNLREGMNPLEWQVPPLIMGRPPVRQGNLSGVTIDDTTMIKDYLEAMDWDPITTRPSQEKLAELGLGGVAKDL